MAAIGVALWKYVMRYSPENPNFFNRDRFVLSNGMFAAHTRKCPIQLMNCKAMPVSGNTHSCTWWDIKT